VGSICSEPHVSWPRPIGERSMEYVFGAFFAFSFIRTLVDGFCSTTPGKSTSFSQETKYRMSSDMGFLCPSPPGGSGASKFGSGASVLRLSPAQFAFYAMGASAFRASGSGNVRQSRADPAAFTSFRSAGNFTSRRTLCGGCIRAFSLSIARDHRLNGLCHTYYLDPLHASLPACRAFSSILRTALFVPVLPFDVVARARGDGAWILRMALVFAPLSAPGGLDGRRPLGRHGVPWSLSWSYSLSIRLYSLTYQRRHFAASFSEFYAS